MALLSEIKEYRNERLMLKIKTIELTVKVTPGGSQNKKE